MFFHAFEATERKGGEDGSHPGLCLSLVKTGRGDGGGEALATLLQFSSRPEPCNVHHHTSFLRLMMCAWLIQGNRLSLH